MEILRQLDEIAGFLWKHAVVAIAIVLVYEGARLLVAGGAWRRGVTVLIPGVLLMALMASLSLWVSHNMSGINEKLSLPVLAELPSNWGADQTPEAREKNSRSLASVTFTSSGKVVKYFDQSGGWQRYCPTDQDIAMLEQAIVVKSRAQQLAEVAYLDAFRWLAFGGVAVVLGVYFGRKGGKCTG